MEALFDEQATCEQKTKKLRFLLEWKKVDGRRNNFRLFFFSFSLFYCRACSSLQRVISLLLCRWKIDAFKKDVSCLVDFMTHTSEKYIIYIFLEVSLGKKRRATKRTASDNDLRSTSNFFLASCSRTDWTLVLFGGYFSISNPPQLQQLWWCSKIDVRNRT